MKPRLLWSVSEPAVLWGVDCDWRFEVPDENATLFCGAVRFRLEQPARVQEGEVVYEWSFDPRFRPRRFGELLLSDADPTNPFEIVPHQSLTKPVVWLLRESRRISNVSIRALAPSERLPQLKPHEHKAFDSRLGAQAVISFGDPHVDKRADIRWLIFWLWPLWEREGLSYPARHEMLCKAATDTGIDYDWSLKSFQNLASELSAERFPNLSLK